MILISFVQSPNIQWNGLFLQRDVCPDVFQCCGNAEEADGPGKFFHVKLLYHANQQWTSPVRILPPNRRIQSSR